MQEKDLLQKIDSFVEQHHDEIIADIKALVDIPSVKAPADEYGPQGKHVRAALDKFFEIAKRFGLDTYDLEGHIGYAQLDGDSEEIIATIGHSDVVPVGNGWNSDPFDMIEKDGYLIGRGTCDDKGPLMLSLYVAKFFKDLGMDLPYSLRVICGCDEETGMTDLDYYLKHDKEPLFCFTPDANFPLIHGEKGLLGGDFISPEFKDGMILEAKSGTASNVVPDAAYIVIKDPGKALPEAERITVENVDNGVKISATGIGIHASTPQGSVNAIGVLTDYLLDNDLVSAEEKRFLELMKQLHDNYYGEKLGIAADDDVFTPLTIIGGMLNFEDGRLIQNMDSRYPKSTTGEKIFDQLREIAAEYGAEFREGRNEAPFYMPADKPEVQACLSAYRDITGDMTEPYTLGGGTYARHFKNAVAFGPELESEPLPDFVGPIHGPNEGISIDLLMKSLKVYILAVYRLMQLEF